MYELVIDTLCMSYNDGLKLAAINHTKLHFNCEGVKHQPVICMFTIP